MSTVNRLSLENIVIQLYIKHKTYSTYTQYSSSECCELINTTIFKNFSYILLYERREARYMYSYESTQLNFCP